MTESLSERLGLGSHELVSIVGAGGKTNILHTLGGELAARGRKVILTTTTKMAPSQVTDATTWSNDPGLVDELLVSGVPLFVCTELTGDKVIGLDPESVDILFAMDSVDYVVVEADGARSRLIKAPDDHEPVIPQASTTVIVVVGAGALGRRLGEVAHRLERIAALTGLTEDDVLTPNHVATILLHPGGGLKSIPPGASVVMAIANTTAANEPAVSRLAEILEDHPRVDRCVKLYRVP